MPPPDIVELGQQFNVTYRAIISQQFYLQGAFFPNKS